MPTQDHAIPTKQEVERQLERMLASEIFLARPQQAKVFAFIVRAALAGREIGEKDIRSQFFRTPPYKPESTVARTTVNFIRGKLVREYYAQSGEDDPVIITLPSPPGERLKRAPGKAYQPEFSYNPRSAAEHAYREGMRSLNNIFSFFDFGGAVKSFRQATDLVPTHAAAHAAMAEARLVDPMLAPYVKPAESFARARTSARRALRLNPKLWRAHVVLGALHTCRYEWKSAQEQFDEALRIDRMETGYHPWYAAFLMAVGRKNEALRLVSDRAEERPQDPFALAIWGLFAYAARDFDTARILLDECLTKNPRNWVAGFASACLRLRTEESDGVAERLVMSAHDMLNMDVFPGLRILTLRQSSPRDEDALNQEIECIADTMNAHDYYSPLQTALGQMAYAENKEALESLSEAFNDRNPYMVWLHLWPFLDPLRNDKKFQRLVARMRLPAP